MGGPARKFGAFWGALLSISLLGTTRLVKIEGTCLPSADTTHFVVENSNFIYLIKKEGLGEFEKSRLEQVFKHVNTTVPDQLIENSWKSMDQDPQFSPSIDVEDLLWDLGGNFLISGELLPTVSIKKARLRTLGNILEIDLEKVDAATARDLDGVGRHVTVTIGSKAIIAVWPQSKMGSR